MYSRATKNNFTLYANEEYFLSPGERLAISTGIRVEIPTNMAGFVVPDKEIAKLGLKLVNSPGLIDSGYRGEVKVIAQSLSSDVIKINKGEKIATLNISEVFSYKVSIDNEQEHGENSSTKTKLNIIPLYKTLQYPDIAYQGDAGVDLRAAIDAKLMPGEYKEIPLGLKIEIPEHYSAYLYPRSGLALKHGFTLLDSPVLIDRNSSAELKIIGINLDKEKEFEIKSGDKICQLVILKSVEAEFNITQALTSSERSDSGFGSSGI